MKAIVYSKPQHYVLQDTPEPRAGQRQVVVRVQRCGICKTDLHIQNGRFIAQFPLTPGHEFCGEIVEVGPETREWRTGDRVTCDNTVLCGSCYYCRRNQPLYCKHFYSLGCTGPGGLAEYVLVNADKAFRIADHLTYDEAVFAEPLACVVHGVDMIQPHCGDKILIFGAGPAGNLLAQLLQRCGVSALVVVASSQFKLDALNQFRVKHTVLMRRDNLEAHVEAVKSLAPEGYDIVIDATGQGRIIEHMFQFTKMGSKVLVYGVCDEEDRIQISPYWIFRNEIKLFGSFAQTHCFDRAVTYLEEGAVCVKSLITQRFPLAEYGQALSQLADGKNLKIMIHPAD